MALDGITVSCIKKEMKELFCGGYITKIAQPEKDELMLTIKNGGAPIRLVISASPSLPLIYIADQNRTSPAVAPAFCMLLRKHIGSGHILDIEQPCLERVLIMTIEHRDELGDMCRKKLIVELMGKHSNIIFTDDEDNIIDSIKRIPASVSSVREVLPGRKYFIPQTTEKANPFEIDEETFIKDIRSCPDISVSKAVYTNITGFSPMAGRELCARAEIDPDANPADLADDKCGALYEAFRSFISDIENGSYECSVYYEKKAPSEFSVFKSKLCEGFESKSFSSVFELLYSYYSGKEAVSRIRQKSADLRKIVSTVLERSVKKLKLQKKQLDDTKNRDKYRIYGELITAYGYNLDPDAKALETVNYYTGEEVSIPLDNSLSPIENAKKYFAGYDKQKRTFEAVTDQIAETEDDIRHLESIQNALDNASDEADLSQISDELQGSGYIKKKSARKAGKAAKAKALHFVSSDGFDIYVGKNNYQNDELTFASPAGCDWWFHSKNIPGSHVVVKSNEPELPDSTFEEAGRLAAYFSKGRGGSKVEIDYTQRKNVKKPAKAKPGFVVYYTNYSMMSVPDIDGITQIQ